MHMKAVAVLEPGKAAVVNDVPEPVLGDYQSLVKIHTCGFCNGTDMQIINDTIGGPDKPAWFPTILGHEGCGEVVEIGPKVRHIHLGEKYIRPDKASDYGKYSVTFGNMAEYAVAVDRKAMLEDGFSPEDLPSDNNCGKLPDYVSFEDGAVALSMLECISAVHNFGIADAKKVLIYGAGPMGLGVAGYLKAKGAEVTMVDRNPARLAYADYQIGLCTINTGEIDIQSALGNERFDAVVDIVGLSSILMEGTNFLVQGGKLCGMGVLKVSDNGFDVHKMQNNTSFHFLNFPYRRLYYMDEMASLIEAGKLKLSDYYTDVMPAEDIQKCIEKIKTQQALKVVLTF